LQIFDSFATLQELGKRDESSMSEVASIFAGRHHRLARGPRQLLDGKRGLARSALMPVPIAVAPS
jgi:hypothetical protein